MVVYIDNFGCKEDIADQFSGYCPNDNQDYKLDNLRYAEKIKSHKDILDTLNSSEVLLAWYGGCNWDGQAMVVYKLEGKLYEVNGSHCSCYGLEGQWHPTETNYKVLAMRVPSPFEDQDYIDAYKEMLELIKDD